MARIVPKIDATDTTTIPARVEKIYTEWKLQALRMNVRGDRENGKIAVRAVLLKGNRDDTTGEWELAPQGQDNAQAIIPIPDLLALAAADPDVATVLTGLTAALVAYAQTLERNPL